MTVLLNCSQLRDLVERIEPYHAEYRRWYQTLVERVEAKRDVIIEHSSEAFYRFVLERYSDTLTDILEGRLGGATLYARAA